MEVELCLICRNYPLIFSTLKRPISCLGRVYCYSCSTPDVIGNNPIYELSEDHKNHYKKEQLVKTCDCLIVDNGNAGYFLDQSNFMVYCENCNKDSRVLINLRNNAPRSLIKMQISTYVTDQNMSPEIKKKLLKTNDMSVNEILLYLRKYLCYFYPYPFCLNHIRHSTLISLRSFEFKCNFCDNREDTLNLNDDTGAATVVDSALKSCRKANTNAFNSIILKYLKRQQNDYQTFINFLYEMRELISSQHDSLSISSICLSCEKPFSYKRIPITMHEFERGERGKHEICSECIKLNPIVCPIDKIPLKSMTYNSESFLYEFKDLKCNNCEASNSFSIKKKLFPYIAKCSHNICVNCFRSGHGNSCTTCREPINISECTENIDLIEKLKFTEIECPTHNQLITKFTFTQEDGLIGACRQCRNFNRCVRTTHFFVEKSKELLLQRRSEGSSKLNSLLQNIDFLPLSYRYSLLNMKEHEEKILLIHNEIIPRDITHINWWYEKGATHDLYIKSNFNVFITGILIGFNSKYDFEGLSITYEGNRIERRLEQYQVQISKIYFNEPILISSKGLFIKITLPKGKYYQLSKANQPRNRIDIDNNAFIEFNFTTKKSGDMNLGGPFCGFCYENFYWIESYFGENSHL